MKRLIFNCALFFLLAVTAVAQTTTTNLGISKPQAGQAQPNVTIATGFDSFDAAIAGRLSKSVAGSSNVTLTTTEARNAILEFTGILTGSINVIVPTLNRTYLVYNGTTGSFTLTLKTSGGTGIAVTQGNRVWLYCDATNVVETSVSSGGANVTLSNLSTTSINTALIPQSGKDLGSVAAPFKDLHLYGGGTFASHSWRFTGTPTGNRVITIPDRTATMATTTGTLTNGRCVEFDASGNLVDAVSASPCGSGSGSSIVDWKDSVRVATTAAGTLATSFENGDTVDGVVLATGNRILIKDQAAGADNGIYVVAASGAPARSTDADTSAEVTAGMAVTVTEGTVNADKIFTLTTNDPITLGSTSIAFASVGSGGSTAWSSLTVPSGDLSLAMAANLTTLTWAGDYSTSSAFKLAGNNTSATGSLVEFRSGFSNNMPVLTLKPRGGRSFEADKLGSLLLGKDSPGNTDPDGYAYLGVIGSNLFPSGTPTSNTGFAPITLQANGTAGDYSIWGYMGSAWRDMGGQHKRYDTGSGSGAQTVDFNSSTSANVTRRFTLTGNVTFTFSNPPKVGSLVTLIIIQDATGGRTVTWPASIDWPGGTPFGPTSTANAKDTYLFVWDGTNYLFLLQSQDIS